MPPAHPARSEFDTLFVDHAPTARHDGAAHAHVAGADPRDADAAAADLHRDARAASSAATRRTRRTCRSSTRSRASSIDRHITMADLAGTIEAFTKAFFGADFTSRLRPSYFPFTEPSAEFDIQRPDGDVDRARRLRDGAPQRAALRAGSTRRSGAGSPSASASTAWPRNATASTTSATCSPTTSASWSSSDEDSSCPGSTSTATSAIRRTAPTCDVVAEALTSLGLAGRRDRPRRRTGRRRGHRPGAARLEQHPDAAKVHRVYVDAGDGVERHVWCGAFNMAARRRRPAGHARHGDARRPHDRAARHPRHRLARACSARPRARPRRRPLRHLILPRDTPLGVPVRRGARARTATCCSTPTSPATGPTAGATSASPAISLRNSASTFRAADARARRRPAPTRARRRSSSSIGDGAAGSRRPCISGVGSAPSADVDGTSPHRRRHAPDQQRRRRQQLRDARAQPAEPRLRPRHARRRRVPRPPGSTTARRLTTLDGHRAHVHRRTTC